MYDFPIESKGEKKLQHNKIGEKNRFSAALFPRIVSAVVALLCYYHLGENILKYLKTQPDLQGESKGPPICLPGIRRRRKGTPVLSFERYKQKETIKSITKQQDEEDSNDAIQLSGTKGTLLQRTEKRGRLSSPGQRDR
jgi:hypothetical protein